MFHQESMAQERLNSFIATVYGLMAGALAITASVAFYVAHTPAIQRYIFTNPFVMTGIFIGQMALVIGLSFFIQRLTFATALLFFCVYAVSVGVTISVVFLVYSMGSIYQTALVTGGMFGVMSLYGYFTKSDLTTIGNIMFMGLIGLILGGLVNLYFQNPAFDYFLSGVGVIVFTLLIAYDAQKVKQIGRQIFQDESLKGKLAIIGALTLYLDFINLFLYLLRFMGRRREE